MFEKLIEAARTCYESGNPIDECCIEGCPNFDSQPYCLDQILKDCVEALTQSGAELKDKDYLIQQQADEIERLRRDVKKQHEKMIELAKARELKEMDEVKTFVHQRGAVIVDCDIYEMLIHNYGREPKRGECILTNDEIETIRIHMNAIKEQLCNRYRHREAEAYQTIVDKLAKMEVQDESVGGV